MNAGKQFRAARRAGVPVTLILKPHLSQPALEVGPMKIMQVDEYETGFKMLDGTDGEREYPHRLIDTIIPHVPGGLPCP